MLVIGSTRTLALLGGDALAEAAANRSVIIEFCVSNVDAELTTRTPASGSELVQPPTTMPRVNRPLLLRDPNCTLVNLFAPVTETLNSVSPKTYTALSLSSALASHQYISEFSRYRASQVNQSDSGPHGNEIIAGLSQRYFVVPAYRPVAR